MSVRYIAVNWNRQKRIYDSLIGAGIGLSLGSFAAVTAWVSPTATVETIAIRGLGLTGFLLLQLIVLIGPLARLDRRFLPLLYNRRHLGVAMSIVGLAHAAFAIFQYHALGDANPLVSVLSTNRDWDSASRFPFEVLGLMTLVIVLLMATTSHDFWLSALGPATWKRLHMMVYPAYGALVAHVGLGFLQDARHPIYAIALGISAAGTVVLHWIAAVREVPGDRPVHARDGWVDVCAADEIPENRAKVGIVGRERVAVFRYDGKLSCVSNVCRHQNGPLGEGKIVDGCITCPWHGYQYRPDTGTSPPPYTDRIPTYRLRVEGGRVLVHEQPNEAGTRVEPVPVDPPGPVPAAVGHDSAAASADFYIGYQPRASSTSGRFTRFVVVTVLALVGGLGAAFAGVDRGYAPAWFDFGSPSEVEGVVRIAPYPFLEVRRPGGDHAVSRYLLTAEGKHGAQGVAAGLDGRRVRIRGPLAYRSNLTLLEIAEAEVLEAGETTPEPRLEDHGTFTLEGELVDSKCYLGVMNPGEGKTHRSCAARCLHGGITPLFAVRDSAGNRLELVLVTDRGDPFPEAADLAGQPITLRGRVISEGDLWMMRVDPSSLGAGR